jgi:hypothetical protein
MASMTPFLIQIHQHTQSCSDGPKIMDLSDSLSSTSSSSPPPLQTKSVARRGRPRLTEDAELAKLVLFCSIFRCFGMLIGRNEERN